MNSCFYGNGTSFVESLFEGFGEQIPRSSNRIGRAVGLPGV